MIRASPFRRRRHKMESVLRQLQPVLPRLPASNPRCIRSRPVHSDGLGLRLWANVSARSGVQTAAVWNGPGRALTLPGFAESPPLRPSVVGHASSIPLGAYWLNPRRNGLLERRSTQCSEPLRSAQPSIAHAAKPCARRRLRGAQRLAIFPVSRRSHSSAATRSLPNVAVHEQASAPVHGGGGA